MIISLIKGKNFWELLFSLLLLFQILLRIVGGPLSLRLSVIVLLCVTPYLITLIFKSWSLSYELHRHAHRHRANYRKPAFLSPALMPHSMAVALFILLPPILFIELVFGLDSVSSRSSEGQTVILLFTSIAFWYFRVAEPVLSKEIGTKDGE
ncbi:hypothetical protein MJO52_12205 [Microbulbifer variabilis]|uniref:Uncharacterized protein n=1 Tax=Microbulbifer variabilis TaxID=266805 RepID=A0ABY4V6E3_9GAMM|nr:hypothetical protein [Microbulbifer variabilis]USD19844.1 hypothetical protein MJO52_12205 [Microbulbifer variabilis]